MTRFSQAIIFAVFEVGNTCLLLGVDLMYNVFAVKAYLLVYFSFVEAIFILNDGHAMKHGCVFEFRCKCECGTGQFLKK